MKKSLLLPLLLTATAATAQVNVQLHYDFGRNLYADQEPGRQKVTSTVEMFKADRLGSTYFFVDMDYYSDGVGGAYWEVSREFTLQTLASSSIAAHVEYDGGLSINKYSNEYPSRFQPAFLLGPAWNWHNGDFSTTFSLQLNYKYYVATHSCHALSTFQLTPVWSTTFADGLFTFAGFADLWYGYIPDFDADGQKKGMVFLSEPQFWVNVLGRDRQNERLSIGTEIELSNNFIFPAKPGTDGTFYCNPTIALKWTF